MTYYPFMDVFFDVLRKLLCKLAFLLRKLTFLVTLKVERLIKINEMPHEDMTRHDAIDSSFTFNVIFFKKIFS